MAKDKGLVRRVLQILSPEDQETLAILHDPPLMEEVLRRQETLAELRATGLAGGVDAPWQANGETGQGLQGLRVFPAVLDEFAALPAVARQRLVQIHLPALVAAPQEGMALTQLFQGLWMIIYTVDGVDYRILYEIDSRSTTVTVLLIGIWQSLEHRLETP